MSRGATVTVAGAGALGLSAALALADAGCRVTVFDPAAPLASASGVAAGMLAPVFEAVLDPEARPHFDLLMAARNLWPALEARVGLTLDRSGALAVGSPGWLGAIDAELARLGEHAAELPRAALEELAPGLSPVFGRALWTREDWRLDAAAALSALRRACDAAGVAFRQEAATGFMDAERLVVATGAGQGLADLAPELAALTPIKGHILRVGMSPTPAMTVRGEGVYVAGADREAAVGATMEAGVDDPTPDPAQAEPLLLRGARLFPELRGAGHVLAAGVRAATPDSLPLVGPGRTPGVVLAVGARRNGWLLAPMAAGIVAACVTERDPGPHAHRLAPGRFEAEGA
ncbi:FAD-dependent oxidoreductase [Phenylobacterium sp.]|uniref:FAD-dependent oxidoreductase n=1 Tax=Phenylobacterium sp. TaxID=1871053 RepID=UPI0035B4E47A